MAAWRRSLWATMMCLVLCGAAGADQASIDTYDVWARHRDAVAKDPTVIRYYTFEGVNDSASKVPSLAGEQAPLSYGCYQEGAQSFEQLQAIDGRYPRKQAVRLDRGFFRADPFGVDDRQMTIEAWLRTRGYGAIRGLPITYGGTLLSEGTGFWDGWRLTLNYPERLIGFEIGRPKPGSSMGFSTPGWTDGVWHHLAATWDGQRMRLYIDGFLAGSADYAGVFTPPTPAQFMVGYADSGWGSVLLDVDEIAVYRRAFAPAEVVRSANYFAPLSEADVARLAAGDAKLAAGDTKGAAAEYSAAAAGLKDPGCAAIARLRLGRALRGQRSYAAAAGEFVRVLDGAGLSDRLKSQARDQLVLLYLQAPGDALPKAVHERVLAMGALTPAETRGAMLSFARAARQERRLSEARELYAKVLAMTELAPRERLDVRLELGHTLYGAGDLAGARAEYGKIAAEAEAPPQYRSYASLLIARTYVREKAWPAAKAEYEKLAADETAPAVHRDEAREKLRELARLQEGLPARDPAWSRMQLPPKPAPAAKLYVAPKGNDNNAGTLDHPFATLERALQAIRDLRKSGDLPAGGVAVYMRGGEYRLAETLKLGAEDSGSDKAPITYRNYESEVMRFSGGARVSGFRPVDDPAVLARLPEGARGKVVQADLRALGITDLGQMKPYGYGFGSTPVAELFFDGKAMQLARWPNSGFLTTGAVQAATGPNRGPSFQYEGDRPAQWKDPGNVWAFGYWVWDWAADTVAVSSIDPAAHSVTLVQGPAYGVQAGHRFYFLNVLEELDAPGEWYLDREKGIAYLYPLSDPAKADVRLSILEAPMVQMDEASHITLQGLTFETSRGDGIVINGGDHCLVAGCTVRDIAGTAVTINGGTGHGALSCDLYTLGRGGTRVIGGDRKTLTPGGHFVENCDIRDFSRLVRTYAPAVFMDGCGNRIAHNLFHDSPGHAMRIEGNDHVIEYNDVHDVVYESDDQGGLDIWFNPSYRGLIMRYNYWHHIGSGIPGGQAGIRLDDAISGVHVYGNVFYKCSNAGFGGIQIHGGKENVVENNIFVGCKAAVSLSEWGEDRWKQFCASPEVIKATTVDVDITKPPYSTRYPELAHLTENHGRNLIWRNLAFDCGQFLMRDPGVLDVMDNVVTGQDPGFVDAAHGNFRIKPGAAIYDRFGFEPVPFEDIGLYQDRLRATWPVRDDAGEHYVPGQ